MANLNSYEDTTGILAGTAVAPLPYSYCARVIALAVLMHIACRFSFRDVSGITYYCLENLGVLHWLDFPGAVCSVQAGNTLGIYSRAPDLDLGEVDNSSTIR